jgi:DNA primase
MEPMAAALAACAVRDPAVLDDHLESNFAASGFGEAALSGLLQEIISLRLEADHLDTDVLARHLAACGFSTLLKDVDRAAATLSAPFMRDDVSLDTARSQWSTAFTAMARLGSLDEAIIAAKGNLRDRRDMEALERLKAERDALRRAIRTGTIWGEDGS